MLRSVAPASQPGFYRSAGPLARLAKSWSCRIPPESKPSGTSAAEDRRVRTVGLSARPSVRCPGPANPSAQVDSSVPAATNLSPDSAPPASATRGRGLAGRVGRAAADAAGIKRRQRKQLVSACPAPDPWSRASYWRSQSLLGIAGTLSRRAPCPVGYLLG